MTEKKMNFVLLRRCKKPDEQPELYEQSDWHLQEVRTFTKDQGRSLQVFLAAFSNFGEKPAIGGIPLSQYDVFDVRVLLVSNPEEEIEFQCEFRGGDKLGTLLIVSVREELTYGALRTLRDNYPAIGEDPDMLGEAASIVAKKDFEPPKLVSAKRSTLEETPIQPSDLTTGDLDYATDASVQLVADPNRTKVTERPSATMPSVLVSPSMVMEEANLEATAVGPEPGEIGYDPTTMTQPGTVAQKRPSPPPALQSNSPQPSLPPSVPPGDPRREEETSRIYPSVSAVIPPDTTEEADRARRETLAARKADVDREKRWSTTALVILALLTGLALVAEFVAIGNGRTGLIIGAGFAFVLFGFLAALEAVGIRTTSRALWRLVSGSSVVPPGATVAPRRKGDVKRERRMAAGLSTVAFALICCIIALMDFTCEGRKANEHLMAEVKAEAHQRGVAEGAKANAEKRAAAAEAENSRLVGELEGAEKKCDLEGKECKELDPFGKMLADARKKVCVSDKKPAPVARKPPARKRPEPPREEDPPLAEEPPPVRERSDAETVALNCHNFATKRGLPVDDALTCCRREADHQFPTNKWDASGFNDKCKSKIYAMTGVAE